MDPEEVAVVQILLTAEFAGTREWEQAVALGILRPHDLDDSGRLDSASELRDVPCAIWWALDTVLEDARDTSLVEAYATSSERAARLGIDGRLLEAWTARIRACEEESEDAEP